LEAGSAELRSRLDDIDATLAAAAATSPLSGLRAVLMLVKSGPRSTSAAGARSSARWLT